MAQGPPVSSHYCRPCTFAMAEIDETMRVTGTVIQFLDKRGFGFIKPDGEVEEGQDRVFVHWLQIASPDKWPRLEKDMVVQYNPGTDDKGRPAAFNVTSEDGGDITLEELDDRNLSKFRVGGTVKFFTRGGYGFIETKKAITWPKRLPAGSDVYVSREELDVASGFVSKLQQGMDVEFNVFVKDGKDGVAAANVTAPGGVSLAVETSERTKGKGKDGKGKGKGGKDGKGKGKGKGKKGHGKQYARHGDEAFGEDQEEHMVEEGVLEEEGQVEEEMFEDQEAHEELQPVKRTIVKTEQVIGKSSGKKGKGKGKGKK
uniref:CSD domain-containing protein n=1 Tax=Noctiluca scintillans TaxID=2966 RepID=A0A7S1EZ66_NOCSC